jgi:hypothetical protein
VARIARAIDGRRAVWLSWAAIAGQVLFVLGWLVVGALERHGYSPGRHDISDLGALTAHHAVPDLFTLGVAGALTIAFALWALRPALAVPGRRGAIGAWLLALSLPGLDNLSDAFFRLDCRAADAGCTAAQAAASWHGTVHVVVATVAGVATIAAPFALAHRFRLLEGWRDLARPARVFGVVVVLGVLAYVALENTSAQGWAQRALAMWVVSGIVLLAWRVGTLATEGGAEPVAIPEPVQS